MTDDSTLKIVLYCGGAFIAAMGTLVGIAWIMIQLMDKLHGAKAKELHGDVKAIRGGMEVIEKSLIENRLQISHLSGVVKSERGTVNRLSSTVARGLSDLGDRALKLETRTDAVEKDLSNAWNAIRKKADKGCDIKPPLEK